MGENYTRKFIFGTSGILVFTLLAATMGYLLRLILAKNLSLEDFGLFYAVFSFVMFFSLFQDLGLGKALVKYISEFKEKKEYNKIKTAIYYVFFIQIIFTLLFSFSLLIFADFLSDNYFHNSGAKMIILSFSIWFVLYNIINLISNIFYGLQNIFAFSLRFFLVEFFVLLVSFILLKLGFGIMAPTYAFIISLILIIIIYYPWLIHTFNFLKYTFKGSLKLFNSLTSFGFPLILFAIAGRVISQGDILILTYFRPLGDVGIYSVILSTSMLFLFFGKAINQIIFPLSNELLIKNKLELLGQGTILMQKYLFIFIIPPLFILFSFPKLFLNLFFGSQFNIGAVPLMILLVGVLFFTVAQIGIGLIMGLGKPQKITKVIVIVAILNLIMNLLLIPFFGMIGAAISTSVAYIFGFILINRSIPKNIKYKFPFKDVSKILLLALIFILLIFLLKEFFVMGPWIELIAILLISVSVYIFLLFLFKITNKQEILYIVKRSFEKD